MLHTSSNRINAKDFDTKDYRPIHAELSSRQVEISVIQPTGRFNVTVYNDSDRFASFQIRLLAVGVSAVGVDRPEEDKRWYRFTPAVSSKIPSGGQTLFQVEIFGLPPLGWQSQGVIDLTLEVTSWELGDKVYDRQPLKLTVRDLGSQPPKINLALPHIKAQPGQTIEIVAQVQNPTSALMEAQLRLLGLPDQWLPLGIQQDLTLAAKEAQSLTFKCQVPEPIQTEKKSYPLTLEAMGNFATPNPVLGSLEVLPGGTIGFDCNPIEQVIPPVPSKWLNPAQGSATFELSIDNQSNLLPTNHIAVWDLDLDRQQVRKWQFWQHWFRAPKPEADETTNKPIGDVAESEPGFDELPDGFELDLAPLTFPIGQTTTIPLTVTKQLPWFGWARKLKYEVELAIEEDLEVQNPIQKLDLLLFPLIPFWLQLVSGLLACGLGFLIWQLFNNVSHKGPVNSVQFSGQGIEVLSASDDQTLKRWQVQGKHLKERSQMNGWKKATRVARYRPVSNDQLAIGLENGEIQLIDLLKGPPSPFPVQKKDDRVFDLIFSQDARRLYSGHGSGLIQEWDLSQPGNIQPLQAYTTNFAIEAMALLNDEAYLAIGGRYNQLTLLQLDESIEDVPLKKTANKKVGKPNPFLDLNYLPGGQNDYISSLATAAQNPTILAIGDIQGHLSVKQCEQGKCEDTSTPWLGHGGSAIRSVALSSDACFFVSGSDDGQVKLWPLNQDGSRRADKTDGRVLDRAKTPINAVDVIQNRDVLWVTSGADDGRVRLYRVDLTGTETSGCAMLAGQ
jgi:WD domain, G-beta repeat